MGNLFGSEFNHLRRREARVLIAVAVVYFILWLFLPKPAFWGLDNGFKFQGAYNFSESGSIKVKYFGAQFDPAGNFRPLIRPFGVMKNGAQFPVFSVPFMITAGVFHKFFGIFGLFLLPLLGGYFCLTAAWIMWIRHRENHNGSVYLLVLALGSPLLFYSMTLWESSISMGFVILSTVSLSNRGRSGRQKIRIFNPIIAGLLIAAAAAFRTESLVWAIGIIVFWSYTNQKLQAAFLYIAGIGAGLLLFGLLNIAMTGEIFPLHIRTNLMLQKMPSMMSLMISRMQNFYNLTIEGFPSNIGSLICVIPLMLVGFWRKWRRNTQYSYWLLGCVIVIWLLYLYTCFNAKDRAGHTIASGGLLWITPFAILALNYFRGERRKFWHLIWVTIAFFIITNSIFSPAINGVHWGPRTIIQAFPFILMLAATRAQRWWRKNELTRPLVVVLLAISILNQFYSYGILMEAKQNNKELTRWANITGSEPSFTDIWWLPGDLSTLTRKYPWFHIRSLDGIQAVVSGLRSEGYARLNFYEIPPYIGDEVWWSVGAEPLGEDYYLTEGGIFAQLRRKWLNINPLNRAP